jgi:aryl-alcohol dehydrogenase-like predicted oxidoreductase
VAYGTFIGKPEDEDDFDSYVAAKYLIRSGAINHIDTAINYRCQKAERTMGTLLKCLLSDVYGPY